MGVEPANILDWCKVEVHFTLSFSSDIVTVDIMEGFLLKCIIAKKEGMDETFLYIR